MVVKKSLVSEKALGIWNGKSFSYNPGKNKLSKISKLVWKYGFSVFSLKKKLDNLLDKWMKIYEKTFLGN